MRWTPDTPGQPPRLLTEPREDEPLTDAGWPVAGLLHQPPKPPRRECLRCGGGSTERTEHGVRLLDWQPDCDHVTRESLREHIKAVDGMPIPDGPCKLDHGWAALDRREDAQPYASRLKRFHPTREGAISLLLDTLVEREVEKIRCPLMWARVPEGADLKEVKSALASLGSKGVGTLAYRVEIEADFERVMGEAYPPHDLGKPCTCGSEDCTKPKPFEVGDVVKFRGCTDGCVTLVKHGGQLKEAMGPDLWLVDGSGMRGWENASTLRHATPEERSEYERTREPRPFAVGDIVVYAAYGTIGRIVSAPSSRSGIAFDAPKAGDWLYECPQNISGWADRLRHATEAERQEYEAHRAPFAVGDIVVWTLRSGESAAYYGTAWKVESLDHDRGRPIRVTPWNQAARSTWHGRELGSVRVHAGEIRDAIAPDGERWSFAL